MEKIPLAKDHGKVGERCAGHPYKECDVHYENLYGFLNIWFGGQGSSYTTEETFNAGHWYELPEGRTIDWNDVENLKQFITIERTHLFRAVYFSDESHIFIS